MDQSYSKRKVVNVKLAIHLRLTFNRTGRPSNALSSPMVDIVDIMQLFFN